MIFTQAINMCWSHPLINGGSIIITSIDRTHLGANNAVCTYKQQTTFKLTVNGKQQACVIYHKQRAKMVKIYNEQRTKKIRLITL